MPLFLDSADLNDIAKAVRLNFIAGVTTNPTLMAKTGRPHLDVLRDILGAADGPVFYQVTAGTAEGRAAEARRASKLAPGRVIVKLPSTTENLTIAATLGRKNVPCCITAVSHPSQAYAASLVNAAYIAVYVDRLTRQEGDGVAVLKECAEVLRGTRTKVLAASIKTKDQMVAAVLAGAHDLTILMDLAMSFAEHELTRRAIEEFRGHGEKKR